MIHKLYCYVDETGQDTLGELFIVAVVITAEERDELRQTCIDIEAISRKGTRKWVKSTHDRRLAYIQRVLRRSEIRGKLYFAEYRSPQDYLSATVETIGSALGLPANNEHKATVFIDGLSRSSERGVGLLLRRSGLPIQKVRGLNDESEPLIRLADAVCGFVRGAIEGNTDMRTLLDEALRTGVVIDLSRK